MEPTIDEAVNALDDLINGGNIEEELIFEDETNPENHKRPNNEGDDNPRPTKFSRPNDYTGIPGTVDTDDSGTTMASSGCDCSCKKRSCEERALYNCKMAKGCKDNGCISWYKRQRRYKSKRSYGRTYYPRRRYYGRRRYY